jgi:hypothetical protein
MPTGKEFTYETTAWSNERHELTCRYTIRTDEQSYELSESIIFPQSVPDNYEAAQLERALHLALGMSYYKAFIPPMITHGYAMTDVEASFWNTVFKNGYGEFLYKNNLNYSQLAQFQAQKGKENDGAGEQQQLEEKALLGIGGGKDSIVAGELLKKISIPLTGFVLATGEILGQTQAVSNVMSIPLLPVQRRIDTQIISINKLTGAYNGHIPISFIFGLIGSMSAISNNSAYVIVANEASSSIPHVKHDSMDINHQWSKSIEFERLFQDYLHTYVSLDLHYFSAIRPLPTLAVAKIFTAYPEYFEVFTSDNSLFKIAAQKRTHPRWSQDSSKSLSSFILLSALLSEAELLRIFGYNFLDESTLQQSFSAIMGEHGQTVLDCVGTPAELRASLARAHKNGHFSDSVLMHYAIDHNLLDTTSQYSDLQMLESNVFPSALKEKLLTVIKEYYV